MVLITVLTYEAANENGALEQFPNVDPATATATDLMRKIRASTKLYNPHVRFGMRLYTYVDYVPGDLINDDKNPLALDSTLDELRLSGCLQFEEDRRGLHLKVLVDGCRTAEAASEFRLEQSWSTEYEVAALRKRVRDLTARLDLTAEPDDAELGAPLQRLPPRLASQTTMQAAAAHPTRRANHMRRIWPYFQGNIHIVFMTVVIVILAVAVRFYHESPDQLNNCNLRDCYGLSPIHQEAMNGQTDKMRTLIKQYLTDLPNRSQEITSKAATSFDDSVKNFVKRAKRLGMDLDEKANDAEPPLLLAAWHGHAETVRVLIKEFGANVNVENKDGYTALHMAAKYGRDETVLVLIKECGANVTAKNKDGNTALHMAAWHGRDETVRVLIKECDADVNAKNKAGYTALHMAAWHGHAETVRVLINECGANVNAKNKDGYTALHMAAWHGHAEAVLVLIKECGANVNAMNDGYTALHMAAWHGHPETVGVLIKECRADVNAKNKDGYTALHMATRHGHAETVRVLIKECRADVNAKNKDGEMLLEVATRHGHAETVRVLINECRADVNANTKDGDRLLDMAAWLGHTETALMLIKECGADVNAKNRFGYTALHVAAWHGQIETVRALIKEFGDVNAMNGDTALHVASIRGHTEIARALIIEFKLNANVRNNAGLTPLGNTPSHYLETRRMLQELGGH